MAPSVLLVIARVTIRVPSGRVITVRALLDQGSEMTFVSESVAQTLRAKRIRMPVSISAVGRVHAGTAKHATLLSLSLYNATEPTVSVTALILPQLTSYAPKRQTDLISIDHLRDINLADLDLTGSSPIQIIIGADLYSVIILAGLRKGQSGEPVAQNSMFGWVLSGPAQSRDHEAGRSPTEFTAAVSMANISTHHCASLSSLEEEVHRFWEVKEVPRPAILSVNDEKCEQHFRATHSRQSDGRYQVRLPFRSGPPIDIGESRPRALSYLGSLS